MDATVTTIPYQQLRQESNPDHLSWKESCCQLHHEAVSGPTGNRTRISCMPCRRPPVGRRAQSQTSTVDTPGVEPGFPVCDTGVLPLDDEPRVIPDGLEPS